MSDIEKLDSEIEILQKHLRKLRRRKKRQLEIATLQIQVQKAKMHAQKEDLMETPFYNSIREVLIKVGEDQVVEQFKDMFKAKARGHPNPLVV